MVVELYCVMSKSGLVVHTCIVTEERTAVVNEHTTTKLESVNLSQSLRIKGITSLLTNHDASSAWHESYVIMRLGPEHLYSWA